MQSQDNHERRSLIVIVMCLSMFVVSCFVIYGCGAGIGDFTAGDSVDRSTLKFDDPNRCGACHPTHFAEWQGSIMHYAAMSPVFNAFELTVRKITNGLVAPNGDAPNLCIGCHSPTGVFDQDLPDYVDAASATPARVNLSPVNQEGISCDFCHTVTGPDLEGSLLADGIANTSVLFAPSDTKVGPIFDPVPNAYHASTNSEYLSSPEFCGSCHDVRLPIPDVVTGEPFQRLENLFTEWQEGPYNSTDNPFGRVVRCQDCHMSLYPITDPGPDTLPTMKLGVAVDPPERRHALHAFTAVSIPLIDDERFPNIYSNSTDQWGFPRGQQRRRVQMLRAACTLTLEGTPNSIDPDSNVIPIRVVVTNVGAGHRVPTGFSQERQVWIELIVRDDDGVIYESGYLRDKSHPETGENEPDGRLNDEDLDDRHFTIDIETLDSEYEPGPDRDQRPEKNLGIKNFQNAFIRIHSDGTREPIINPLLADTMDNSRSLPMLEPVEVLYDVPVPQRGLSSDIQVSVRLRYRTFPPEFLRILAIREPQLVSEKTVDQNTIVDMAETSVTIELR